MSAFIVDRAHIAYLVEALQQFGDCPPVRDEAELSRVGQMLWDENVKSVDFRYREKNEALVYGAHVEPNIKHLLHYDPLQVLASICAYEYQSCEHDGWDQSEARKLMTRLTWMAIQRIPGYGKLNRDYPEESTDPKPISLYDLSKQISEQKRAASAASSPRKMVDGATKVLVIDDKPKRKGFVR